MSDLWTACRVPDCGDQPPNEWRPFSRRDMLMSDVAKTNAEEVMDAVRKARELIQDEAATQAAEASADLNEGFIVYQAWAIVALADVLDLILGDDWGYVSAEVGTVDTRFDPTPDQTALIAAIRKRTGDQRRADTSD